MRTTVAVAVLGLLFAAPAGASDLKGPGRFCGYSPIVDLKAGETVTTLDGGVHSGRFLWEGPFGSLKVNGIGWASRPGGLIVLEPIGDRPARFAQRRVDDGFEVAIWNGRQGAAYFSSSKPLTRRQLRAIDRVRLYQEGDDPPPDCNLRTFFSWE